MTRMPRLLGLVLLVASARAVAHPLDLGFLQAKFRGAEVEASLDLNPKAASELLGLEVTQLSPLTVDSRAEALLAATLGSGKLSVGDGVCRWGKAEWEITPQIVRIKSRATCPAASGRVRWEFPFVKSARLPSTFQVMVRAESGGAERVFVADRAREAIELSVEASRGLGQFVWMGIEHIGAAPSEWRNASGFHLPDGIDHILFLVALILGGGTLGSLLATATGFTVGHSVTLALATLGVVRFPSRVVESAIALSIAYVALETVIVRTPRHRWKIAALFGLVHGFGFASALTQLSLSRAGVATALVGFNLGVELGQAVIVALLAPVVAFLRRAPVFRGYAVPACSFLIFLAGSYWFVQRAFGLGA